MEGITRTTYELFEIIIVISLFLIISTAIIYTNQPNFNKANLIATEISKVSYLIDKNTEIKISLPKEIIKNGYNLNINNNYLEFELGKTKIKKKINEIKIKKENNIIILN